MRVILYSRVSTNEQSLGLSAQDEKLWAEVERRSWHDVVEVCDEGVSGSVPAHDRPHLGPELAAMQKGDVVCFAKLDRLSRSMLDFATLLEESERTGWSLVCLDPVIDTTTPNGKLIAHVLMAVAQWERETISQRVRDGLAQSKKLLGRRPGLPPVGGAVAKPIPATLAAAVEDLRDANKTASQIASRLNAQGHKSLRGKRWHATSVNRLLRRLDSLSTAV